MAIISVPNELERLQKPPFWQTRAYGLDLDNYLTNGLIGCWLLNEGCGASAIDLKNVSNGVLSSGVSWTENNTYFNGSSEIGVSYNPFKGVSSFSIVIRLKTLSGGNFSAVNSWTQVQNSILIRGGGGSLTYYTEAGYGTVSIGDSYTEGKYHTFVFYFSGTKQGIYKDGIFSGDTDQTGPVNSSAADSIRFGGGSGSSSEYYLTGNIDFVYIYSRALVESEVVSITQAPYQIIHAPRWSHFVDLGGAAPSGFLPSWAWRKVYTIGGGTSVSS